MATTERRRLRESEARVRALVESITDYAIFLLDESGRVTTWSRGAELIKGYREDEIIDRHFSVFYLAEDVSAGKPERGLEIAAREGRFEEEGWRVRKDGSRFMADVVITPVRDLDGELLGYAKVTRDVTAPRYRKRDELIMGAQGVVARLFEVGMELQGLAVRTDDATLRDRLEVEVAKLDEAIRQLRTSLFHPDTTPAAH